MPYPGSFDMDEGRSRSLMARYRYFSTIYALGRPNERANRNSAIGSASTELLGYNCLACR